MPANYLLDTNTASYIIKGNVPRVRQRLLKVPASEMAIPVITEAELRFGVLKLAGATRLAVAVESFLSMSRFARGILPQRGNMRNYARCWKKLAARRATWI